MADEMFTMENAQSIVAQIHGKGTPLNEKRRIEQGCIKLDSGRASAEIYGSSAL
jgi:hypothetical protein